MRIYCHVVAGPGQARSHLDLLECMTEYLASLHDRKVPFPPCSDFFLSVVDFQHRFNLV